MANQRRSQDFFGGGQFSVISEGRPDAVGGGVVAEIFRGRRKPGRFSGGGR